jgi:hypothetical protein
MLTQSLQTVHGGSFTSWLFAPTEPDAEAEPVGFPPHSPLKQAVESDVVLACGEGQKKIL